MAGISLRQVLNSVTPRMVWCAVCYHIRTAVRIVQITQPELHGPAYWQAVLKVMWAPDKSKLHPYEAFELPGDVTAIQFDERKRIIIRTEHGVLRLTVLAADLVQITFYANSDQISGDPFSYSVIKPENAWTPTEVFVLETENLVEITAGAIKILVDKQPCSLTIQDKSGKYLLRNLQVGHHPNGQQIICRANYDKQTAFYGLGEKLAASTMPGVSSSYGTATHSIMILELIQSI